MTRETGVVKFNCRWIQDVPVENDVIQELNEWREKLYQSKMIGEDEFGIGYGNISIRKPYNQFIISGSGTGKIENLTNHHYAKVIAYDIEKNFITVQGPVIASSESLTHAMIYECDETCNAVMHIHHVQLWKKLLNVIPTTSADIEYGTPAMAKEVQRLFSETDVMRKKIFVMAGHEQGIVSFGTDLAEAGKVLHDYFDK